MVVPRSAKQVASDDEFALFAVVTFKKHSTEFIHKCREKRWTPREYKHKEGGKEEEAMEANQLAQDEKKLWGEALRLGRTGYSESAMIWIHVLALRVFVETVLRYGLPPEYVCGLVQVGAHIISFLTSNAKNYRRTPSQPRRPNRTSTRPTRTWAVTLSVGTAKVASRKTTKRHRLTCRQPDMGTKSTPRTCTTSLKSTEHFSRHLGGAVITNTTAYIRQH
jgi:hypothetical protein